MKKASLIFVFCLALGAAIAQKRFTDSIAIARNGLTQKSMLVLGSWAVANITSGLIIAGSTKGEARYFWLMNSYWNFFNLGLAGLGYLRTLKPIREGQGFAANELAQQSIEKLYVLNLGLDLVYITGGFYLREHGLTQTKQTDQDTFRGYGSSLILQGGFLLIMDCVMYSLHHKNSRLMNNKLQQLELGAGPGGLAIRYSF